MGDSGRRTISERRTDGGALRLAADLLRPYRAGLPLLTLLGVAGSALEGVGIGLLVPVGGWLLGAGGDLPGWLVAMSGANGAGANVDGTVGGGAAVLALAAILALVVLRAGVQAAGEVLAARIEGRAAADLRQRLAAALLAPGGSAADADARMNLLAVESWRMADGVRAALNLLMALAALAVFALLLVWLDGRLAVLALAGAGIVAALLALARRRLEGLGSEVAASNARLAARMLRVAEHRRVIVAFAQEGDELAGFGEASDALRRRLLAAQRYAAKLLPLADGAAGSLVAALVLAGWALGVAGPVLAAFLLVLLRTLPPLRAAHDARALLAALGGTAAMLREELDRRPAAPAAPARAVPAPAPAPLALDQVQFAYPHGSPVLAGVDLVLAPGSRTALVGASGAGKSTLAALLARLLVPTGGRVLFGGEDAAGVPRGHWPRVVALAGQDLPLVGDTLGEAVTYAVPGASADELAEMLALVGMDRFVTALPGGIATPLSWRGLSLSGGQRQRLALARALLLRPQVLVFDEATNALDALAEAELLRVLGASGRFGALLAISHRAATLALCDSGAVLDGGRVVETGPLASLAYYRQMRAP